MPISNNLGLSDSFARPVGITASAPLAAAPATPAPPAAQAMGADRLQLSPAQRKSAGSLADDPYIKDFLNRDPNQDGWLSGTEIEAHAAAFDADGDGALSPAEYLEGRNKAAFDAGDKDGDGKLTGSEQLKIMAPWRKAADANQDGGVDRAEYNAYRHGFREVGYNNDKNADGFLTGDEIRPGVQKYATTDAQGRSLLTRESYMQQKLTELNAQKPAAPRFFGTR